MCIWGIKTVKFTDLSVGDITRWEWSFDELSNDPTQECQIDIAYDNENNYSVYCDSEPLYTVVYEDEYGNIESILYHYDTTWWQNDITIHFDENGDIEAVSYKYMEDWQYDVSLTIYGPDCPDGITETKTNFIWISGCNR